MSETVLPPNPCLLAVVLVTQKRDGTSEVFHYPPQPGSSRHGRRQRHSRQSGSRGGSGTHFSDSSSVTTTESSSGGEEDFAAFEDVNGHGAGGVDGTGAGSAGGPHDLLDSAASSLEQASGSKASDRSHGGDSSSKTTGGSGNSTGSSGKATAGFLGLPAGYHHFLCPPSTSFNKRRFELTIDSLVFLGRPAYAREDGTWRKKRDGQSKKKKIGSVIAKTVGSNGTEAGLMATPKAPSAARRQSVQLEELTSDGAAAAESSDQDSSAVENDTKPDGTKNAKTDMKNEDGPVFEAGYAHDEANKEEEQKAKEKSRSRQEMLNMFNIVFVMNPPPIEYQRRVDEMYKFVVKKFAKALKWEQSRSDFILKESEHLRHLKSKHVSTDSIVKHSPLAKAIAEVFWSISASKIAQVNLTPRTSFSVQLPLPTSISVLPSLTEPQLPGIWLTTSNSIASADTLDVDISTSRSRLAAHFALLLLASPASIIAEVSASDSPLAPKLARYLHHTRPSKSFAQISQSSSIPLTDVQFLASHLIYWRRARAIPPLHHRDIYITSPNADMKRLRSASTAFSRTFPALPGLPKMLSLLGAGPRPYSTFIPSKDHKGAYMEILAWLMQGGWVTQLRSYAWVRVTPEVRALARENARLEERAKELERRRKAEQEAREAALRRVHELQRRHEHDDDSEDGQTESEATDTDTETVDTGQDSDELSSTASGPMFDDPGEPDRRSGTASGYLTPTAMESSMYSTNSGDSTETARTTIPLRSGTAASASSRLVHSHLSTVESASYSTSNEGEETDNDYGDRDKASPLSQQQLHANGHGSASSSYHPSPLLVPDDKDPNTGPILILSPARASGMEIRYLTAIAQQMEKEDGRPARDAWETCLKYFNGEHAMEKIAVREGWKRKKVEALRARWRSRGVLLEVRHW